jgi:DNA anti-recombination protein RmuC
VTENARQIAFQGKQLYKRLAAFLSNLSVLGRHLDQTVIDYNKAVGSLETRVLPAARRLKETGASGTGLPTVAAIAHQTVAPTYAGSAEEEIKDASGS